MDGKPSPIIEILGRLSLSELVDSYSEIPNLAELELSKWIKLDNSDEIDTYRFIYASQSQLDSIRQLLRLQHLHYHNLVWIWLKKLYNPASVVEEDFLDSEILKFEPVAKATQKTLMLCQELFTRREELQRVFGNFQHMWLRFELSKPLTEIAKILLDPESSAAGKETRRRKMVNVITSYEEIVQGLKPSLTQEVTREQLKKQNELVTQTYHSMIYPGHLINAHAAQTARECAHFDRHYFKPWLNIHKTVNNLARKPGFLNPVITPEGLLSVTEKCFQVNKTRKRKPKSGFG
jgi:hypothetical protein